MEVKIMDRNELKRLILEIIRSGEIVLDVTPVPTNDANEKVSEFTDGSPIQPTDYLPMVRDVSGTLTNFKGLASTIPGGYDPFDAKVSNFTEFTAAITAGKWCVNVEGTVTFTADFQLPISVKRSIVIYLSQGSYLSLGNYQLDVNQNNVYLKTETNGVMNYLSTTAKSPFTSSGGLGVLYLDAVLTGNGSTVANTPLTDNTMVLIGLNGASSSDNGLANSGVNLTVQGSFLDNFSVSTNSTTSQNILTMANGCFCKGLKVYNIGSSTNNLITVGAGCSVSQLAAYNGAIKITNNGLLHAVEVGSSIDLTSGANSKTTDSSIRALTITGSDSLQEGTDFSGAIVINSGVDSPRFIGCNGESTFTNNGTNFMGAGNIGSIPNTGGSGGVALSPFQACLDGVGSSADHYIALSGSSGAYAAGKTEVYTIANITETADISMLSTDQIYLLLGQGFTWNLSTYNISGALDNDPENGGNDFGLEFADGSSTFEYSTAGLPFLDFDNLSSIVFTGNGGIIQNNSATANSYIYSAGVLLAYNLRFLLPNVAGGGFKTSGYTHLSDIKFTGGGVVCEKAIIADGGKLSNIVLTGNNWKSNGFINDIGTHPTVWDTLYYDVDLPMSFYLDGQAINVLKNISLSSAFLTVVFASNSTLTTSYADAAVLTSGVTGCKVIGGTLTTVSLATDNTTEVQFIGVTFPNNTVFYGKGKLIGCTFVGGGSLAVGANFTITGCTSGASTTFTIPSGAAAIRAGNDSIIGNDYGGASASIEFFDAQVDGVGTLPYHYATWNAALATNPKTILVTANTSLTGNITLANDIFVQFKDGSKLNTNNYQIIHTNFVVSLSSNFVGDLNIVVPSTQTIPPFSDTSGNRNLLILNNVGFDLSAVTSDNCEVGGTSCVLGNNVLVLPGNANRCGIAILSNDNFNGYLINSSISCLEDSGTLTNTQRVLYVNGGTTDNLLFSIEGPPNTNIVIDVQTLSSVNNTTVLSNDGFIVHNAGQIRNLDNLSDSPIDIVCTTSVSNDPFYLENVNIGNGNLDFNSLTNMSINNVRLGSWSNLSGSNVRLNNISLAFLVSPPTLTVGGSNNTINELNSPNPISGENADYGTLTMTGSGIYLNAVRVSTLKNDGNNNSLMSCSATAWSETGTGRESAGCHGAIPNSYLSFPLNVGGWQFSLSTVANNAVTLVAYAGCNGTLLGVGEKARAFTTAGTFAIAINGTNVGGLTAVVPTTAGSYTASTSANTFSRGDTITITYTGTLAVLDHAISLDFQRSS